MRKVTFFVISCLIMIGICFTDFSVKADSKRMLLIEEFTNTYCGPCANQNPYFKAFVKQNLDKLIPVVFHPNPGITNFDKDMFYVDNPQMHNYRFNFYGLNGVPYYRLNGKMGPASSGYYQGSPADVNAIQTEMNKYAGEISPITINIEEKRTSNNVDVTVDVSSSEALSNKKLYVVVVEYSISPGQQFNGETEFLWIARKMLPDHNGTNFTIPAGGSQQFKFSYTIKGNWQRDQLYTVAFVQNQKETNTETQVLQAATSLKTATAKIEAIQNPYMTISRNGQIKKNVVITNPNSFGSEFEVEIDYEKSYLQDGWNAVVEPNSFYLEPDASQTVTVTLNSSDYAALCQVAVKAKPVSEYTNEPTWGYFFALAENVKYAFYTNYNSFSAYYFNDMKALNDLFKDAAFIPYTTDFINAYNPMQFPASVFTVRSQSYNQLLVLSPEMMNTVKSLINNGKSVYLMSDATLGYAFTQTGTDAYKDFYTNMLGIGFTNRVQRWHQDGNYIYLDQFTVNGVTGDPVGDGISGTANQTTAAYDFFTDIISIPTGSQATKVFYFDGKQTDIAGVRAEKGNARIVYTTFGIEAFGTAMVRQAILRQILEWLIPTVKPKEADITFDKGTLDFGKVEVGQSKDMTFTINSIGDTTLVVTDASIIFDDDNVFQIVNLTTPFSLQPGQSKVVTVRFTPKEEKKYDVPFLEVNSNAKSGVLSLTLIGQGFIPESVYDDTYSNNIITLSAGPNPFDRATKISFNLNGVESRYVELYIVDGTGKRIANLVNSYLLPGIHDVEFNSEGLASGTYFVIANVNGTTLTMPIVIAK